LNADTAVRQACKRNGNPRDTVRRAGDGGGDVAAAV